MQPFSFYHEHLQEVSRSFSFCISQLGSPEKEWVALSYLLFRIVDTIEDSNWPTIQQQSEAFNTFKSFLFNIPSKKKIDEWIINFPSDLPLKEKCLLGDTLFLLEDKHKLPGHIKQALIETIVQMISGMQFIQNHFKVENKIILTSIANTNQYCFFVAGIVGKLLSQIFTSSLSRFNWSPRLLNQSFHFGFFLQKINLLRDKLDDEARGCYFFSSAQDLRESLVVNAYHSLAYIKNIPIIDGRSYRLFCAWSLFIGLASLKGFDKNGYGYKIKSQETYYLVKQVDQLIDDNHALEQLFACYVTEIKKEKNKIKYPDNFKQIPEWFKLIYTVEQDPMIWQELYLANEN